MAPKNATVRLGLSTVPLERMPMTQDDKSEARKRYVLLPLATCC